MVKVVLVVKKGRVPQKPFFRIKTLPPPFFLLFFVNMEKRLNFLKKLKISTVKWIFLLILRYHQKKFNQEFLSIFRFENPSRLKKCFINLDKYCDTKKFHTIKIYKSPRNLFTTINLKVSNFLKKLCQLPNASISMCVVS